MSRESWYYGNQAPVRGDRDGAGDGAQRRQRQRDADARPAARDAAGAEMQLLRRRGGQVLRRA